mmetsp:Transcript_6529/g.18806  ORF Transcript_6529/g.18806 Transcript_6529/m.18806 type:complete len:251 (-) Transcript_6529:305-1057(-)
MVYLPLVDLLKQPRVVPGARLLVRRRQPSGVVDAREPLFVLHVVPHQPFDRDYQARGPAGGRRQVLLALRSLRHNCVEGEEARCECRVRDAVHRVPRHRIPAGGVQLVQAGVVQQGAATQGGSLGQGAHGHGQGLAGVRVLPHAVLHQQLHVHCAAPPRALSGVDALVLRGEGVVEGTPLRNGGPQLHAAQQGDEICVRRAAAAPQGQNLPSIHGRFVVLGPEVRQSQRWPILPGVHQHRRHSADEALQV